MEVEEIAKQAVSLKAFIELYKVVNLSFEQSVGRVPMANIELPADYFCALVERSVNIGDEAAIRRYNEFCRNRARYSENGISAYTYDAWKQLRHNQRRVAEEDYMTFDDLTNTKEDT